MSQVIRVNTNTVTAYQPGSEGQKVPFMSDEYIETVSERYIELYENITGEKFIKADVSNIHERIEKNVLNYLK